MPARRVTFVTHTAELGGAETAMLRVASSLDRDTFVPSVVVLGDGPLVARLADAGIECTVIQGGAVTEVSRAETSSLRLPGMIRGARAGARELATALTGARSELAIAHSLKAAVLVSIAARRARIPWVWHLNDRLAPDYLPRPAVTAMRTLAARGPKVVVANSRATLATLGARGRARAVVAYPGLPSEAFALDHGEPGVGAIGLIGRVSATKGQLEFIEAARALHAERPALRFRIVGAALFSDGEYEERVREAAAELPDGVVTLTGWVDEPHAELRRLAVLVHASPVPEPFGQVLVEGMAAGVPVVATRAGGVTEILDPDDSAIQAAPGVWVAPRGVLVEPGDPAALVRAVEIVLDDPEGSSDRVAAAERAARADFTIDTTARAVTAAWRRALGEGAG